MPLVERKAEKTAGDGGIHQRYFAFGFHAPKRRQVLLRTEDAQHKAWPTVPKASTLLEIATKSDSRTVGQIRNDKSGSVLAGAGFIARQRFGVCCGGIRIVCKCLTIYGKGIVTAPLNRPGRQTGLERIVPCPIDELGVDINPEKRPEFERAIRTCFGLGYRIVSDA